jgi:hypothetical protein
MAKQAAFPVIAGTLGGVGIGLTIAASAAAASSAAVATTTAVIAVTAGPGALVAGLVIGGCCVVPWIAIALIAAGLLVAAGYVTTAVIVAHYILRQKFHRSNVVRRFGGVLQICCIPVLPGA